jgi:hypothetical protein
MIQCAKTPNHIWNLPLPDLQELLGHLEENLEHGSIYAHATMKLLRDAIATHNNYLGFSVVSTSADVETANRLILAEGAPTEQPQLKNYSNKIAYLKDKIRYEQAQRLQPVLAVLDIAPSVGATSNDL